MNIPIPNVTYQRVEDVVSVDARSRAEVDRRRTIIPSRRTWSAQERIPWGADVRVHFGRELAAFLRQVDLGRNTHPVARHTSGPPHQIVVRC